MIRAASIRRDERGWERGASRGASRRTRVLAFACLLPILLAIGCRTVEPWERAAFAAPRMESEPHGPHAAFLDHVRQSREPTATGQGAGGGGCGCY